MAQTEPSIADWQWQEKPQN